MTNSYADEIDDLIPCIIEVESGGDSQAIGDDGNSYGLMQINVSGAYSEYNMVNGPYDGWNYFTPRDLLNPYTNKKIGEWYLRRLKDHYLKENYTVESMLASYNGGPTRMNRLLREGKDWRDMPRETVLYVNKIMKLYRGEK